MVNRVSSPGIIALVLIVLLTFSLGLQVNHMKTALEDAYASVAIVVCGKGYGTGWWINDHTMITAFHVVQQCLDSNITVLRNPWKTTGHVIAYDPELDVAAISVERPSWAHVLKLARSVGIGDEGYVIGYPIQLYEETSEDIGKTSEIPRVNKIVVTWINPDKQVFEFSPGTDSGNSGGPIVSDRGGVLGIVVYARKGVVSEGYYGLRADALAEFFQENSIEYSVAGTYGYLPYAGLILILVFGLLVLNKKSLWGWG